MVLSGNEDVEKRDVSTCAYESSNGCSNSGFAVADSSDIAESSGSNSSASSSPSVFGATKRTVPHS